MVDNLFFDITIYLRYLPSILISVFNFCVCIIAIKILADKFEYAGLCCYMVLSSIIANIQILYATSYEFLNAEVLLGTVIFCSSFLACDIINSRYGAEKARQAIYLTLVTDLFFLANIIFTIGHKPIDYSQYPEFSISKETIEKNMEAINTIFLPVPRLLISSYITYFISQISEIWLFNAIKKLKFLKFEYIKHNISLFISSIFIDTLIFTSLGLCLMATEPLSLHDFWKICYSTLIIRAVCNLGNTFFMKFFKR